MGNLAKLGLSGLSPETPVLIAGPTASGKSGLALSIAQEQGGVIINADASQIYECWRVITACPSPREEALAPHALYRCVPYDAPYSAGHWLRAVAPYLEGPERPIIVGGTGLYFTALTRGLADIPPVAPEIRIKANGLSLNELLSQLDAATLARIDTANRARVQRAWEVLHSSQKSLAHWQDHTPPALLSLENCEAIVIDAGKDWLDSRIRRRFDLMIEAGALDEIAAMQTRYDPALPSCRAIGVPELMQYYQGHMPLSAAREAACIATRQYAKRQRTWHRSKMKEWKWINLG